VRIGIFSECYQPTLNGVVVSTNTFKDELEKMGHEIFIFAPRTNGFIDKDPDHVFRYPSTTLFGPNDYPIGFPILAPSIAKKAAQLNLDIIHAQHSLAMISHSALKIARHLNIPIVHTYHTLLTEYIHWKIGASIGKSYVKNKSTNFCNYCDQIITPSTPMKKIVESYGVKTPIEVIPTGIDLKEFQNPFSKEELFEKWQVPKDKKILLYLSRIASEKNLDFLFSAVMKLSHKHKDFHLLLVGGGTELPKFKSKAKKIGIDGLTTFADKQPKEIANRFFGTANIFVFPSVTETQGIVIADQLI
jgi:1,2-diacylglycerol 3-alpha-glucosyltransferase